MTEQSRVHNILQSMARGNSTGQGLTWNPYTKRVEPAGPFGPGAGGLHITPEDMKHYAITE